MKRPHTQILMSTFHGERFLRTQLDSLINQDYSQISILIRDDGSSDQTVPIIKTYQALHSHIQLIEGSNIGVVNSFFSLLQNVDTQAAYFALCDQDDIWSSNKISTAVSVLSDSSEPQLFLSLFNYIDAQDALLGTSAKPRKALGIRHALVQNRFPGCTMVFNRAALELVTSHLPDLGRLRIHDWWIYLVVAALGKVHFEHQPLISYRQHETNTIGLRESRLDARIRRLLRNERYCTQQAILLKECFEKKLDEKNRQILMRFLSARETVLGRIRYAITKDVYRQEPINDLILRALILLNRV